MSKLKFKTSVFIDNVFGWCPECAKKTFLVAIVSDYYKCTNCGEDIKQYINGHIKYLKLTDWDKEIIKKQT